MGKDKVSQHAYSYFPKQNHFFSFTNAKIIGGTKVDPTVETVIERNGKPAPDNIIRNTVKFKYFYDKSLTPKPFSDYLD